MYISQWVLFLACSRPAKIMTAFCPAVLLGAAERESLQGIWLVKLFLSMYNKTYQKRGY
jgi:hypothetical protein